MTQHEQFADELVRYLLDELTADERRELERHLGACGECRAELVKLRGDAALLTLSSPLATPPPRARARLMAAIAREPRMAVVASGSRPRTAAWWVWIPSFATLALAIAVGLLWHDNLDLRHEASEMTTIMAQQEMDQQKTKEVIAAMTAPGAMRATLIEAGSLPQAHGKASYNPKNGDVVFMATNLKQLPTKQAYQLWLVPVSGGKPVAAGSFKPNEHGTAVLMKHDMPKVKAKLFAVTVEPEEGTAEPSTPVVLTSGGGL